MFELHGLKFGCVGTISNGNVTFTTKDDTKDHQITVSLGDKPICDLILRQDKVVDMVSPNGEWIIPVGHIHPIMGHFCTTHNINFLIGLANQASHLNN